MLRFIEEKFQLEKLRLTFKNSEPANQVFYFGILKRFTYQTFNFKGKFPFSFDQLEELTLEIGGVSIQQIDKIIKQNGKIIMLSLSGVLDVNSFNESTEMKRLPKLILDLSYQHESNTNVNGIVKFLNGKSSASIIELFRVPNLLKNQLQTKIDKRKWNINSISHVSYYILKRKI